LLPVIFEKDSLTKMISPFVSHSSTSIGHCFEQDSESPCTVLQQFFHRPSIRDIDRGDDRASLTAYELREDRLKYGNKGQSLEPMLDPR
ncbi:MAG: hypothetical protein ACM3MD_08885, partial [Betaproteobacteria bacterium]